ncbi:tetracycline resistance protein tetb signature [Lucifera butyrica]|uniref:Tetracycline resistance protein tetb signature n=1 Tax=Lucifera butyrica TaxID=1351585 RepID=A0A498R4G4_9FIRM|nr:DHA2 family efflux MFS transporter permease subunit [Lucifera butyrica]VBB05063.1 tetracycline resistance protein tetb signature [Lucifera butyrica]
MLIPRLNIPDSRYRWFALGTTLIGGFMSILDTSIVNIAVPKMMAAFSVGTDDAQWILTAYMLTMGVLQPATGYLCNTFGARRMYLLSLFTFVVGSALCGMAWSNDSMIAFRVFQAIGGGLIIPITMSIVYQEFPPAERNIALGIWGMSVAMAPAVGPTLSGYLVDYWDWRYIFTINIPVGILGYVVASLVLRETTLIKNTKFDYAGFLTSSTGLFCLLLALSKGVDKGWDSFYIVSLLYAAFALLTLFILIELSTDNPMLDLTLFKDWNFTVGSIFVFITTTILMGSMFMVPLFLENLLGHTAMQSGMLLLPAALVGGFLMPVAAKLADRFGAKPFVILGALFALGGTFPLMYIDLDTSSQYVVFVQILRGVFIGLAMMTCTVLSMNNVPMAKVSQASAINNTLRQVSGSFGIAVLSTVLQNRQIFHTAQIAAAMNNTSPAARTMIQYGEKLFAHAGSTASVAHQQSLVLLNSLVQRQAIIFTYDDAFWVLGVFAILGVVAALLLKQTKAGHGGQTVVAME